MMSLKRNDRVVDSVEGAVNPPALLLSLRQNIRCFG